MSRHRGRAIGLLVAALIMAGCGDTDDQANSVPIREGGVLTYAADQEPNGFNVNTATASGTAARSVTVQVLPAAFHATPGFEPKLNTFLLESAKVASANPQTVVYRIREEAVWSDGTPITADDFAFLWRNMNGSKPENDVATTAGYEDISSVTGSDDGRTVTVRFSEPFAEWKSLFSDILPAHVVKRSHGGWNHVFDRRLPVSGGPFKLAEYTPGESLRLVRNPAWWGPTPHLKAIVFRFMPDAAAQATALANGEVDLIAPMPQLDLVSKVRATPGVTTTVTPGLQFEHLDFNFANPHLAQLEVRQAIAHAIDRNQLVKRTIGQVVPDAARLDNRVWLPGQAAYVAHGEAYARQNLAASERLLEEAGYTRGEDGVWAKDGRRLALRLVTTTGNALREQQAVLIQKQLAEAGIEVTIETAPVDELFGTRLPQGNFDLAMFSWIGTPFPISSNAAIYTAGGGGNYGQYSSARVDRLFERASQTLNRTRLVQLSNEIDRQLWADMVTLPLYQTPSFLAYRDTLGNIRDNTTTDTPFRTSYRWGFTETGV